MKMIRIILIAMLLSGCAKRDSDKLDVIRRDTPIPKINTNQAWHLQFDYSAHHGPVGNFSIHIFSDGSVVGNFVSFKGKSNIIGGNTPAWFASHFSRWFNESDYRNYGSVHAGSKISAPLRALTLYHQDRFDIVLFGGRGPEDYLSIESELLDALTILDNQEQITLDYAHEDLFDELMKTESIEIKTLFEKLKKMQNQSTDPTRTTPAESGKL